MARGNDDLGSEDFLPSVSNLDMMWLDESILSIVGEDGRACPWVDPLLSPVGDDDEDDDLYDDEDEDDDLDDVDDFDEDDEDFFDDDDLDEDEDEDDADEEDTY